MATPRKAERARLAAKGKAQTNPAKGAPRGSYPTDTKGRAGAAKGYATKAERAGRMSKATERSIDARADRELGKKPRKR
jgi:hypothetical protein